MGDCRRLILPVLAVAAVVVLAVVGARRTAASAEGAAGPPGISAADRAATFHFAPDTAAADRDAVLAAGPRGRSPAAARGRAASSAWSTGSRTCGSARPGAPACSA